MLVTDVGDKNQNKKNIKVKMNIQKNKFEDRKGINRIGVRGSDIQDTIPYHIS